MKCLSLVLGAVLLLAPLAPLASALEEWEEPSEYPLSPTGGGAAALFPPTAVQLGVKEVLQDKKDKALAEVWERHEKWEKIAKSAKMQVQVSRKLSMGLFIAGGALQTFSKQGPNASGTIVRRPYMLAGTASVLAADRIKNHFASKEQMELWTHARVISEKIKGQVFRFRAAVPPYENGNFDAIKRLVQEVTEVSRTSKELTLKYARTTLGRKDKHPLPPKLDRDGYFEHRYEPFLNDYLLKFAKEKSRKVALLKGSQTFLVGASSIIGSLSCITGFGKTYHHMMKMLSAWPQTLTATATIIGAQYLGGAYEEAAQEWSDAAMELENLRMCLPPTAEPDVGGPEENEWMVFVERCEELIWDTTQNWSKLKNKPEDEKEEAAKNN